MVHYLLRSGIALVKLRRLGCFRSQASWFINKVVENLKALGCGIPKFKKEIQRDAVLASPSAVETGHSVRQV